MKNKMAKNFPFQNMKIISYLKYEEFDSNKLGPEEVYHVKNEMAKIFPFRNMKKISYLKYEKFHSQICLEFLHKMKISSSLLLR